jgi:hypothetical protein
MITTTPPARYVVRLVCLRCEIYYLGERPELRPVCPACGQVHLALVDVWDLQAEAWPPWLQGPRRQEEP